MKKFPRCGECGGEVVLSGGKSRSYALVPRVPLTVPDDFEIPTCTRCGEEMMTPEIEAQLEDVLGEKLRLIATSRLDLIRETFGVTLRQVEDAARVTPTYLSHVRSGEKRPSGTLLILLDLFAEVPGAFARAAGREQLRETVAKFVHVSFSSERYRAPGGSGASSESRTAPVHYIRPSEFERGGPQEALGGAAS